MKNIMFATVAAGVLLLSSPVLANDDDYQKRLELAKAYEEVAPMQDMMDKMIAELQKNPAMSGDKDVVDVMYKAMDTEKLKDSAIESMANTFTVSELEMLAAFYATPEGQSIQKKMPKYMREIMPVMQGEFMKGVAAMQNYMNEKAAAAEPKQ